MEEKPLDKLPDLRHLIYDHGILKSFNVNRRVTKTEITKIARSMGMDLNNIDQDEIQSVIATISNIEYSCGEVPGTMNSSSRSLDQYKKNYKKLTTLVTYSLMVQDLLKSENLDTSECIFILNKCIADLQSEPQKG